MHKPENIYDTDSFFHAYREMTRSRNGLSATGEWNGFTLQAVQEAQPPKGNAGDSGNERRVIASYDVAGQSRCKEIEFSLTEWFLKKTSR